MSFSCASSPEYSPTSVVETGNSDKVGSLEGPRVILAQDE